jgi:hypothetical protein
MRLFLLLATLWVGLCAAQDPNQEPIIPRTPGHEPDRKLPNGKSQNEEILKAEYARSLKDAQQLVELSQSLQSDLTKETSQVLSLGDLKKLDEIEKIVKRIRGRMRRF